MVRKFVRATVDVMWPSGAVMRCWRTLMVKEGVSKDEAMREAQEALEGEMSALIANIEWIGRHPGIVEWKFLGATEVQPENLGQVERIMSSMAMKPLEAVCMRLREQCGPRFATVGTSGGLCNG